MSLLPSEPDTSAAEEAEPRVIGVDSEDADDVLSALTSETARAILNALHEEPAPPAQLADRVDTSLQNAQYHLNKLEDAGAIEVIDQIYSEKGREMNVYAPADQPLVIFAGKEEQTSGLRAALSRLLGSLGILALASVAVQAVYGEGLFSLGGSSGADSGRQSGAAGGGGSGGDTAGLAANASETTTATPTEAPSATYDQRAETAGDGGGGVQIAEATPTETAAQSGGNGGGGSSTATPQADMTATATEAPQATETATPMATGTPTPPPETVADGGQIQQVTEEPTRTVAETATPAATEVATDTATTVAENATTVAASGGAESVAALPPGLVFFAGGATALLVGAAVVYLTR